MTKSEMRFLRRELINEYLRLYPSVYNLRQMVIRIQTRELLAYGQELKAYK